MRRLSEAAIYAKRARGEALSEYSTAEVADFYINKLADVRSKETIWYCPDCGNEQLDHNGGACLECGHAVVNRETQDE